MSGLFVPLPKFRRGYLVFRRMRAVHSFIMITHVWAGVPRPESMPDITKAIKIIGVQYAVNPDHKKDSPMTEEEKQHTIDFLSLLDRKRPIVSVTPEPSNLFDPDAFVVRWMSRKCGYVRNSEEYKSVAHAALGSSGGRFFKAKVCDVVVGDKGYFMVEVVLHSEPKKLPLADKWSGWDIDVPPLRYCECELMLQDSLMMLEDIGCLDADEVREYCDVIVRNGRNALWREAKQGIEALKCRLETIVGMHDVADMLERMMAGICNEHREMERRQKWWPGILESEEAADLLRQWRCDSGIEICEPSRVKLIEMLVHLEQCLLEMPAIVHPEIDNEVLLMSRAHYALVPEEKWRKILSALIIRRSLREELGLPTAGYAPVQSVMADEDRRFVERIVEYAETLTAENEVRVLQTFIYKNEPYLPPYLKQLVDGMTVRFLEQSRQVQDQTDALLKVAERPVTQNNVYPQANSTTNVGCDQKNSDFKTFLPESPIIPSQLTDNQYKHLQ